MTTPQIDLQKFCAHDGDPREYLHAPWACKGWMYATNGHIMVRVPCPDQADAEPDHKPAKTAPGMFDDAGKAKYMPLPKRIPVPRTCSKCAGAGKYLHIPCGECDGKGTFKHGSHDYDCLECGGMGFMDAEEGATNAVTRSCTNCEGKGAHRGTFLKVAGAEFDVIYLLWIAGLPGALFCPNGNAAAHFIFDGGEGLLMPRSAD